MIFKKKVNKKDLQQDKRKKELILKIDKLKNIKETLIFDDEIFFIEFMNILKEYNCEFGYQNKGSKKHGHVKRKINLNTKEESLELKIERDENLAGKVYVIIHELTHLINEHVISKNLSRKQKEVVADTTAIMYVKTYGLYNDLLKSNMSKKWNVKLYSNNYINNMAFSLKKEDEIIKQIKETYCFLIKKLSNEKDEIMI